MGVRRAARRARRPRRADPAAVATPTRSPFAGSSRDPAAAAGDPAHASRPCRLPTACRREARRVPVLASTKHGFNSFRESRAFAVGGSLARRGSPIRTSRSRRPRPLPRRDRGLRRGELRPSSTTGSPPAPSLPPPRRGRRPLCVGRLVPIKGHDVLFRAFARRAREVPELELDLAGRGAARAGAATPCGELGLGDAVDFLGRVRRSRRSSSGAGSSSSRRSARASAWSRSRRWSAGGAVIASDVGGLPEIVVDGETGLLVPPATTTRSPPRSSSSRATRERRGAMGRAGRERAVERFAAGPLHRADGGALRGRARRAGLASRAPAEPLPGAFEREGREQREQEVPRHAVARRPGEDHRHRASCRPTRTSTSATKRRGAMKRPATASSEERHHEQRLGDARAACSAKPLPAGGRPSRPSVGCQSIRVGLRRSFGLLAGVVAPEVEHLVRGRSASARTRRPGRAGRSRARSCRGLGPRCARRGARARRRSTAAAASTSVGVHVVRLPERARVGRDREAAHLHLVPDDPRRDGRTGGDDDHERRHDRAPAAGGQSSVDGEDEGEQR